MQRKVVWILLVVIVLIAILIPLRRGVQLFLETDSCLDRGGAWNYEKHLCEGARE